MSPIDRSTRVIFANVYNTVGNAALIVGTALTKLAREIRRDLDAKDHSDPAAPPADQRKAAHTNVEELRDLFARARARHPDAFVGPRDDACTLCWSPLRNGRCVFCSPIRNAN